MNLVSSRIFPFLSLTIFGFLAIAHRNLIQYGFFSCAVIRSAPPKHRGSHVFAPPSTSRRPDCSPRTVRLRHWNAHVRFRSEGNAQVTRPGIVPVTSPGVRMSDSPTLAATVSERRPAAPGRLPDYYRILTGARLTLPRFSAIPCNRLGRLAKGVCEARIACSDSVFCGFLTVTLSCLRS
jgi:hypothetical protein